MLKTLRLGTAAATAMVSIVFTPAAWAGPTSPPGNGVTCPPTVLDCNVDAGGSTAPSQAPAARSGAHGGTGTQAKCVLGGSEVPCYRPDLGWFSSMDDCYWRLMNPQPAADDPIAKTADGYPADGDVSKGKFYVAVCPDYPGANRVLMGGDYWLATPPPGFGGGPDPAALAQRAVTKMRLEGADVGIAPKPGGKGGSVGLPVWVWNGPGPRTTGPTSASATALGVTVTATAAVRSVAWSFGDGTTITCPFPGTPYAASFGTQAPDASRGQCGFAGYAHTGAYTVTATSTWAVRWAGGGRQGDLTTTRTSRVRIRIGEVQVLGQ